MPGPTLVPLRAFSISPTGLLPPSVYLSRYVRLSISSRLQVVRNPSCKQLVWPLSISLAATLEIDVSFSSSAYLDVSVQRVPFVYLWIQYTMTEVCSAGFPHSEIGGSPDICSSPPLIAAYHVFLRLSVPRHPPCALSCLTFHYTVAFASLDASIMWFKKRL